MGKRGPAPVKDKPCPDGEHEFYPDYSVWIPCPTPLCHGAHEYHCKKCGWYITEDPCGTYAGTSIFSHKQIESMSGEELSKAWQNFHRSRFGIDNREGEIAEIPKYQLSSNKKVGDHFHANGFEFKILSSEDDHYKSKVVSDNRSEFE